MLPDTTVPSIPPVVETAITTLSEAAKVATTMGVIIASTMIFIKWIKTTNPVPLSNDPKDTRYQDLKRYNNMCHLYTSKLHKEKLPVHWQLKDNCPESYRELTGDTAELTRICDTARDLDVPMKQVIVQMIALIEQLFESIRKRSYSFFDWKKYRQDGFE